MDSVAPFCPKGHSLPEVAIDNNALVIATHKVLVAWACFYAALAVLQGQAAIPESNNLVLVGLALQKLVEVS